MLIGPTRAARDVSVHQPRNLTKRNALTAGGFAAVLCALTAVGCSGDPSGGAGCTTDDECKGDRICVDRSCVDPGSQAGGHANAAGSSGHGGSGEAGRAAGSGAAAGAAGTTGPVYSGGVLDDPELEAACSRNCQARDAAGCTTAGSPDQCLAQCLLVDEQNYGYCWAEQTAQYSCLASGGYTCGSGYPQQKATCITESQALSACYQKAPCRRFCERVAGTECAPSSDCMTECTEQQTAFKDAICGSYYTQLLSCWGQSLTCNGSIPAVAPCGAAVAEVADCVGLRNHACDGYCWAAELSGCGSEDCVTNCRSQADETSCGYLYRRLVQCTYDSRELRMACEDGVPTPTAACDSERQQYETCKGTM